MHRHKVIAAMFAIICLVAIGILLLPQGLDPGGGTALVSNQPALVIDTGQPSTSVIVTENAICQSANQSIGATTILVVSQDTQNAMLPIEPTLTTTVQREVRAGPIVTSQTGLTLNSVSANTATTGNTLGLHQREVRAGPIITSTELMANALTGQTKSDATTDTVNTRSMENSIDIATIAKTRTATFLEGLSANFRQTPINPAALGLTQNTT